VATIDEVLKTDIALIGDMQKAPDGDYQTISGLNNIRQALFRRLLASQGSLVHRPDYGVGIKDFLNAPSSLSNQRALALRVQEQFEQDSRVEEVVGLRFDQDDDVPEKFTIFVKVRVAGFGEPELSFQPFGGIV